MVNQNLIFLDFEEWIQEYKPISKNITPCSEFCYKLETYGFEYECFKFMYAFFPQHTWTFVGNEYGWFFSEGWHFCDRICYYITEKPFNPVFNYQVDY